MAVDLGGYGVGDAPTGAQEKTVKIMRTAAYIGIAKKLYDEARKPQNQARIKAAVAKVQERRGRRR